MNTPIMLTPRDIFSIVVAVCGAVVTVSAAVAVVVKAIQKIKEPEASQNERIKVLEEDVDSIKQRLQLGNKRFESDANRVEALEKSVNQSNKIIIEALQVIISHDIDGNNHESLRQMKHKLDSYLLDKSMGAGA